MEPHGFTPQCFTRQNKAWGTTCPMYCPRFHGDIGGYFRIPVFLSKSNYLIVVKSFRIPVFPSKDNYLIVVKSFRIPVFPSKDNYLIVGPSLRISVVPFKSNCCYGYTGRRNDVTTGLLFQPVQRVFRLSVNPYFKINN